MKINITNKVVGYAILVSLISIISFLPWIGVVWGEQKVIYHLKRQEDYVQVQYENMYKTRAEYEFNNKRRKEFLKKNNVTSHHLLMAWLRGIEIAIGSIASILFSVIFAINLIKGKINFNKVINFHLGRDYESY